MAGPFIVTFWEIYFKHYLLHFVHELTLSYSKPLGNAGKCVFTCVKRKKFEGVVDEKSTLRDKIVSVEDLTSFCVQS